MTVDMATFSLEELELDAEASKVDIAVCELALLMGVTEHEGQDIQKRLDVNKKILAAIKAELARRG